MNLVITATGDKDVTDKINKLSVAVTEEGVRSCCSCHPRQNNLKKIVSMYKIVKHDVRIE